MVKNIIQKWEELKNTVGFQNANHHCMIIGHYGENHSGEQLAQKMEDIHWRVCRVGFYNTINNHSIRLDLCISSFLGADEIDAYLKHRRYIKLAKVLDLFENDFDFVLILQNNLKYDLKDVKIPVHYYHTEILHPYMPHGIKNLIYAYPEAEQQLSRIFDREFQLIEKKMYLPHAVNLKKFMSNDLNNREEWNKRKHLFGFRGIFEFPEIGDYLQDNIYNLRKKFIPIAEELGLYYPKDKAWTDKFVNFMHSTKIALNIPGLYGGINQRMMEAPAAGCILLNYYVKGMEDIGFIDGKTCYTFKDSKELKEKYNYIINNMDIAYQVARNGFHMVQNNHTYLHRALYFILLHYTL